MILIVDDDPVFLGAVTEALTLEGSQVLAAGNAVRALHFVEKIGSEVGVVLIDLNLGSVSGFDLIQAIKAIDANLPVIAFSGVLSQSVLESATMLGAAEVLQKPFSNKWHLAIERVRRSTGEATQTAKS
jgi:two-component system C4-dicarboxylate transport response regulator DctD